MDEQLTPVRSREFGFGTSRLELQVTGQRSVNGVDICVVCVAVFAKLEV